MKNVLFNAKDHSSNRSNVLLFYIFYLNNKTEILAVPMLQTKMGPVVLHMHAENKTYGLPDFKPENGILLGLASSLQHELNAILEDPRKGAQNDIRETRSRAQGGRNGLGVTTGEKQNNIYFSFERVFFCCNRIWDSDITVSYIRLTFHFSCGILPFTGITTITY